MEADLPDARQQAALFWPRVWIYAGLAAAIPEPGNILPFTIAGAGLHVERLASRALEARLNRAQQGGCLVIPQQCHGDKQMHCPQAACAFSHDRIAAIKADTPERERLLWQFLGNRPDRLAKIAVREEGGFIRFRMTGEDGEAEKPLPDSFSEVHEAWWLEAAAPWHNVAHHLFHAAMGKEWKSSFYFPNLILFARESSKTAVILQPLGPDLTRCRVAYAGTQKGREAVKRIIDRVVRRSGRASAEGADFDLQHAIMRVCRSSSALPVKRLPPRRLTPSFGFLGG